MSLRVVLGTSVALMLISPSWAAAAVPAAKQSSVASDRHASSSRLARKEAADEERPRKGRAEKEDSDDKPARKARAQKDDSDDKPARKARAQKEDADDKPARKARVQKDDADDKPARKARAQKDDSDDKPARKARAQKEDADDKPARKARVQKDDADDKPARKARAQKDDSDDKPARKARVQKDDSDDEPVRKGRAQRDSAQKEESSDNENLAALKRQLRDLRRQVGEMERLRAELAAVKAQVRGSAHAALEPSSDSEALAALKQQLRDLRKQVADTEHLRVELAAAKAQARSGATKPVIWGGVPLTLSTALVARPSGNPEIDMLALGFPDMREADPRPPQPPVNPATASLPAVIREQPQTAPPPKSSVEEAKAYLVKTATPGYTMTRQGISLAIDRLHPGFAVKLAEAVKRARDEGLTEAGIFSAYRPPAFGIGGFKDKFQSFHSYGLAVDITGIGSAGSTSAHRWHQIVLDVGLYLPYGPDNGVEFNHTQLLPEKVAPSELRETITADGPIDLHRMWLTSGVDTYVNEPAAVAAATGAAGNAVSTDAVATELKNGAASSESNSEPNSEPKSEPTNQATPPEPTPPE
jgi:hypothetical protein